MKIRFMIIFTSIFLMCFQMGINTYGLPELEKVDATKEILSKYGISSKYDAKYDYITLYCAKLMELNNGLNLLIYLNSWQEVKLHLCAVQSFTDLSTDDIVNNVIIEGDDKKLNLKLNYNPDSISVKTDEIPKKIIYSSLIYIKPNDYSYIENIDLQLFKSIISAHQTSLVFGFKDSEKRVVIPDEQKIYLKNILDMYIKLIDQSKINIRQKPEESKILKMLFNISESYDKFTSTTFYTHKNMHEGPLDIVIMVDEDKNVTLSARFHYSGSDWIFFNNAIILADDKRYNILFNPTEIDRNNKYDGCSENAYILVDPPSANLTINDLVNISQSEKISIRLSGDSNMDYELSKNAKQKITEMLCFYLWVVTNKGEFLEPKEITK